MATAAVRQFSPVQFSPVVGALEIAPRLALELVPEASDESATGLACRWDFHPMQRRLVAVWEQRSV